MEHLPEYLFILSVLIISVESNVVKFDFRLLHKYKRSILIWIAGILLGVIITSWIK